MQVRSIGFREKLPQGTIRLFRNLKVKNPEKYGWDPKWLLSHLIDIYLHLDSDALIIALANDQV